MIKVLVACEESQETTTQMRKRGYEAYSCDILEPSGNHPEWHILGDCLPLLNGNCTFKTMDGIEHHIDGKWDLIIAHPPCTYLTVAGNRYFNEEVYGDKARKRKQDREEAIDFFMKFVNADCDHIVIENPVGVISSRYRKPDQIIHPWMFGDPFTKSTCLWIKGLPLLQQIVFEKPEEEYIEWVDKKTGKKKREAKWCVDAFRKSKSAEERQRIRSKTFPGIAKAFAEQWGEYLKEELS